MCSERYVNGGDGCSAAAVRVGIWGTIGCGGWLVAVLFVYHINHLVGSRIATATQAMWFTY